MQRRCKPFGNFLSSLWPRLLRRGSVQMLRFWQRVHRALDSAMGLGPRFPSLAPAVALNGATFEKTSGNDSYDITQIIEDMRILLGVPKRRTAKPKKQTRKFSYTRLLSPTTDLVTCQTCGALHQEDTICGQCYEKVRELTNEIKRKMMQYNPYKGERQDKQVLVRFSNEILDDGVLNGKRIIEMERGRPTWFKKLF